MLLEKRRTLVQRILRQIRIETHQSQRRKTDQSGDCNKARCKLVVVAVGNCTRAMCVRARRCHCSSTESARSPPQRLYIPGQFVLNTSFGISEYLRRDFCCLYHLTSQITLTLFVLDVTATDPSHEPPAFHRVPFWHHYSSLPTSPIAGIAHLYSIDQQQ